MKTAKRRFFDIKKKVFLYLPIHSPGLFLYCGKPLGAKFLKALGIHEAPLTGKVDTCPQLAFAKPDAYRGGFSNTPKGKVTCVSEEPQVNDHQQVLLVSN